MDLKKVGFIALVIGGVALCIFILFVMIRLPII